MPKDQDLARWIINAERDLQRLIAVRDKITHKITKRQQAIEHVKHAIEIGAGQNSQYAEQQTFLRGGRFKDAPLRDAVMTVLKEQKNTDLEAIVNSLTAGGFDFSGRSAKRTVFLTLRNLSIRKDRVITLDGTHVKLREVAVE